VKFSWGQRVAVAAIAWCLRRRPGAGPQLRQALNDRFRHRTEDERVAMWQAALDRNGVRVG
jgi:hypothetical protein